jgi:hypothetical protein
MPTEPHCFVEHSLSNTGIGGRSLFGVDIVQVHITWVGFTLFTGHEDP